MPYLFLILSKRILEANDVTSVKVQAKIEVFENVRNLILLCCKDPMFSKFGKNFNLSKN